MRSKLSWFLLAASVALNLFFVAGVIYPHVAGHRHPPHWRDPMGSVAEEFSLDERQMQALGALRDKITQRRQAGRGERDGFHKLILDALRQPAFDRGSLGLALAQHREGSSDMILDVSEDLHAFLAGLTPEQKEAFLARAAQDRDFLRRLLFPPSRRDKR